MGRGNEIIIIDDDDQSFALISGSECLKQFRFIRIPSGSSCQELSENLDKYAQVIDRAGAVVAELDHRGDLDGFELLKMFGERFSGIPVIVLSSRRSPADAAIAIELGAFDFVRKPFDERELSARIKNAVKYNSRKEADQLSRTYVAETGEVKAGMLTVNMSSYLVTNRDIPIKLPPKETELLFYLASNPGMTLSRKELLEKVWGFDYFGTTRTVDVHIRRIRKKLYDTVSDWSIDTVWGVGYKFELLN